MSMNYREMLRQLSGLGLMVLFLAGCNSMPVAVTAAPALLPTVPPAPTATPVPDITVCATGCDFTTIQAAIDAESTAAGAIIGVADAVHTERNIQLTKHVIIQGRGALQTIVQAHVKPGEATGRVFYAARGITATLQAMTIRHGNPKGSSQAGGGILNGGTVTLHRVVVSDNHGSAGGGILKDGTLPLINSTARSNHARGGSDSYLECKTGGGIKDLKAL
jgi:hypothetical protein